RRPPGLAGGGARDRGRVERRRDRLLRSGGRAPLLGAERVARPALAGPGAHRVAHPRIGGRGLRAGLRGPPPRPPHHRGAGRRPLPSAAFPSGDRTVVVRLSSPASDLVEDLRERRQLLMGHGVAIVILAVLGAMTLLPPRRDPGEGVSPQALGAYEEAMGRLRDRGEALSREHEVERRRMEAEIRESQAMARAGELTAGIVHEVRNGLGTILGYARLLERDESSPAAADAARGIREDGATPELVC